MHWLPGILILIFLYGWFVEPALLFVRRERVAAPVEAPIRILFLSDFQVGVLSSRLDLLLGKLKRLQREDFDLILLGGDYLDSDPRFLWQWERLLQELARFKRPMYAVYGNHDYFSFSYDLKRQQALSDLMKTYDVDLLRNQAAVWEKKLVIVGMDDLEEAPAYGRHGKHVPLAEYPKKVAKIEWYTKFDDFHPKLPRVLLVHNPDGVYLPGRTPDLTIAGHTHGGMVFFLDWLSRPLWRLLSWFLPAGSLTTTAGRRVINGRTLIIGRGVGGSALPFRLLRPPEAVIVTLERP